MNHHRISTTLLLLLTAFSFCYSQTPPAKEDRENARTMLSTIKSDLQKNYYDPKYGGMNLDERFKTADEKINQAVSLAQLLGIVGQVLLDLNDSHTFFLPPGRTYKTDYGWQMKAIGVKKRKALILDLRGNGGGYVDTLLALIGNVADHEVKVGQLIRRKEQKEMIAKSRGNEAFTGKIIVLIDSQSASASELFARVVQLEKRGTIIGDRSAGAVMRSRV